MIKSLKVNKLNQQMSFDLKFHDDINIITGKNGSGKTTLLKLLWYAISGNLERIIQEISFESFELETDSVRIEMKFITAKPGNAVKIDCTTQEWGFSTLWFESESEPQYARTRQIAEATGSSVFFPTFRRIEGGFSTYAHHHADVVANPNQTPNSYFVQLNRGRPTELQKAMLQLSERLSVSEHRFVASISTDDLSTLLNSKYAEISEKARRIQTAFQITSSRMLAERTAMLRKCSLRSKSERQTLPKQTMHCFAPLPSFLSLLARSFNTRASK
jgi:predicted ATPase